MAQRSASLILFLKDFTLGFVRERQRKKKNLYCYACMLALCVAAVSAMERNLADITDWLHLTGPLASRTEFETKPQRV